MLSPAFIKGEVSRLEFEGMTTTEPVSIIRRRPVANDVHSRVVRAIRQANPSMRDYVFNGTCDMAFASAPSVVLGPGGSEQPHAADEFTTVSEIAEAIGVYAAIGRQYFPSAA